MIELGFTVYIICDDGDYIHYGKELEVYYNHDFSVAMLMFIFDKLEQFKSIRIRRFDLHDSDYETLKRDYSNEYLESAREEIKNGRVFTRTLPSKSIQH